MSSSLMTFLLKPQSYQSCQSLTILVQISSLDISTLNSTKKKKSRHENSGPQMQIYLCQEVSVSNPYFQLNGNFLTHTIVFGRGSIIFISFTCWGVGTWKGEEEEGSQPCSVFNFSLLVATSTILLKQIGEPG